MNGVIMRKELETEIADERTARKTAETKATNLDKDLATEKERRETAETEAAALQTNLAAKDLEITDKDKKIKLLEERLGLGNST